MSYSKTKTDIQVAVAKWLARRSVPTLMLMGSLLGRLFGWLPNRRKRVARTNLLLCFPELDDAARRGLLRQNLRSTGQGVMEMLAALWGHDRQLQDRFTINGLSHLTDAMADGQGCLLLSCHTTSIEWGIKGLNRALREAKLPVGHMLARQHNNKLLEAHFEAARLQFVDKLIDKKNLRSLLRSVQSGHSVYYAPDQNFSYQVAFAEFFGQPAATTLGTQKLAEKGIQVIPWFCFRLRPGQWEITILPAMTDLVGVPAAQACQQVNQLFEQQIRRYPEQYLWVHRRFKNQPDGAGSPYD
ncbi:lysophospholipid acyltransferase family protein [Marinicella meishanensis]|uniref:lysophospholipid acyltransferase family protein n=1 Tax=Marinicella meishanensis TaxID=2873263 RepID=UPI001CC04FCE|nr:lysophospholipid acyltransferase family protein [Marinicella sp. NBU2979]